MVMSYIWQKKIYIYFVSSVALFVFGFISVLGLYQLPDGARASSANLLEDDVTCSIYTFSR